MSLLDDVSARAACEYTTFLTAQSECVSVGDFILLYGLSDLVERNTTFAIQSRLPGWVAIGDDSGGMAILMQLDGSPAVYRCTHRAIGSWEPELVADSFQSWFAGHCRAPWMDDDDDDCDTSLV